MRVDGFVAAFRLLNLTSSFHYLFIPDTTMWLAGGLSSFWSGAFPPIYLCHFFLACHAWEIGLISCSFSLPLLQVRMVVPASLYEIATKSLLPHLSRVRLTFTSTSVGAFILLQPWWLSQGLAAQSFYTFYCGKTSFHHVQLIRVVTIVALLTSSRLHLYAE